MQLPPEHLKKIKEDIGKGSQDQEDNHYGREGENGLSRNDFSMDTISGHSIYCHPCLGRHLSSLADHYHTCSVSIEMESEPGM